MEKEMAIVMQAMLESFASFAGSIPNEVAKTLNFDYINESNSKARLLIDKYKQRLTNDYNEMNEGL